MAQSRNALMLFSKPPIPGQVKTRLTKERGGIFTPEQAADFYHRSLFDVTELAMQCITQLREENRLAREADPETPERIYDFYISTTPEENVERMRKLFEDAGEWPVEINYMCDRGSSFDEHFDDAFAQLFGKGYDNVVAIGGDIPTVPREHILNSFKWLDYFAATDECGYGFVEAPCQECGVSIIGQTKSTPIDSQGVYYNLSGRPALDAYTEEVAAHEVPTAYFSPIADVDEASDLSHTISCLRAIAVAAKYQPGLYVAHRVLEWANALGIKSVTPPNGNHDPRQYIDGGVDYSMPDVETPDVSGPSTMDAKPVVSISPDA